MSAQQGPQEPTASELAFRLGAKRNGKGWRCFCGAHRDLRSPNLDIAEGQGGKALLKCRVGCSQDAILTWLRDTGHWPEPPPRSNGHDKAKRRIVATYDYHAGDGSLVFQSVRYEPKGFTQRRPDGNGGWIWNLKNVEVVLYRLPTLLAAPKSTMRYLCEGEKDADRLAGLKLTATTNPMGAGNFKPEQARCLHGCDVAVLIDNDEAGEKRAVEVPRILAGIARSVRVIRLPGLGGEDVSDWLDRGGTVEELERIVGDTPAEPRNAPTDDPYSGLAAQLATSTWLARDVPPVDRLLGDLITTTSRAFLIGPSGLGKTMLGLGFAMGMGFGTGFLHWRASRPARVLYIDGEMPAELLIQRLRDAARRVGREDYLDNVMVFSTEDAESLAERWPMLGMFEPLNTEAGQDFIKRLIAATKPDAIILDNVQALVAGVQKDEETWVPVLPLVQWLTKQRVGQLWIDHTNKLGTHYGTSTKSWRFDAAGLMTALDETERNPHEVAFLLAFEKARRRTPDNWDEFAPHILRLRDDVWTSEPAEKRNGTGPVGKVPPSRMVFYDALVAAIGRHGNGAAGVPLGRWESEAQRRGLVEPSLAEETANKRHTRLRDFRKAKSDLIAAKWVIVDGDLVIDLRRRWT